MLYSLFGVKIANFGTFELVHPGMYISTINISSGVLIKELNSKLFKNRLVNLRNWTDVCGSRPKVWNEDSKKRKKNSKIKISQLSFLLYPYASARRLDNNNCCHHSF